MHPIKKLLVILRDELKNGCLLPTGLCHVVTYKLSNRLATDELEALKTYIENHRPKRGKHFDIEYQYDYWYWKWGDRISRIDWLNDQIKNFHKNRI